MNNEKERLLLQHQTLKKHHPQQFKFFNDPTKIHLDFTKPVACSLSTHQQVSEQTELGL